MQGEDTAVQMSGPYKAYIASEKANVAQRAAEFGVTNTIRFFASEFAGRPLNESTIRVWVKKYKKRIDFKEARK